MDKDELYDLVLILLAGLIKDNSGSIEAALDSVGITDTEQRKKIKDLFGWKEEPWISYIVTITKKNYDLDTEEIIFEYDNDCSDATNDKDAVIETLRIALGGAEEED